MKAEIITLTPDKARELLDLNINNRSVKKGSYNSYVKQMVLGQWKENGEPIIIDKNGHVKDGQHRLLAVIESNHTFNVPLITGVNPDVMDTIDTGSNRSLKDVLELNGFKYYSDMSTAVKSIIKYDNAMLSNSSGSERFLVTNSVGLDYANKNKDELINLIKCVNRIQDRNKHFIISKRDIYTFLYAIAKGYDINEEHEDYFKGIVGHILDSNSSTSYVFNKLLSAKNNKIQLSKIYLHNLIVKCWNIYTENDMPIKRMSIDLNTLSKVV